MKYSRDIQSLSVFKRDTAKFLNQIKETGEPLVLTVNGRAAAVLHDPDSYDIYLAEKEKIETVAAIKRGIEDMKAGRVRPAADVFRDLEARYQIPRK